MKTINISKSDMLKRISFFKKSNPLPIQMDQSIPQKGKDIVYARELHSIIGLENNSNESSPINRNAPIKGAAGITMTIAKCPSGQGPSLHNHQQTYETFTVLKGKFLIEWNDNGSEKVELEELDTISIPPGVCRSFKNISEKEGLLQVIISGGVHDMNDIAFTKASKVKMENIEKNLSKKFEKIGFKFDAGNK